jgi:glycosyltransferase involved in cell wall biosynthesis
MSKPLVSILLPSLNVRSFLQARIESLLAQTCNDWEAIVLDSHSNDGSWEFFQSIAATDARFRLYQIPADGLYAALNRGLHLAKGEFLHIATCDDTMAPEFLSEMLGAFDHCPEAGLAVCNLLFIDRLGNDLAPKEMIGMSKRGAKNLLALDIVRTAFPDEEMQHVNYRPVPHDCLLHFSGRSVYCSLNQLLIRVPSAKAVALFETQVGSVADFGWLLRLTSATGSVHLPKKLAMWRYHGEQLSLYRDRSRHGSMKKMAEHTLRNICERDPNLLSRNDQAALLLPLMTMMTGNPFGRVYYWLATALRLVRMLFERPAPTLRGLRRARFRFWKRRYCLLPMIFEGIELGPRELTLTR